MTAEMVKDLQGRFGAVVQAMKEQAQSLSELEDAELAEVNGRNEAELSKLRLEVHARTSLPDGREIALSDYAALRELALANGLSEEVIFGGVIEIEDGRVVKANFNNLKLTDISALSGLVQLEVLNFSHNQLTDISGLSGLGQLRILYLSHNQLTDISGLSGLGQLRALYLYNNQLTRAVKSLVKQLRREGVTVEL